MSTSHKAAEKGRYSSVIRTYLLAAAFCALFGAVYEAFGHGVYSPFMLGAFAFPLLIGALPFHLLRKAGRPFPGALPAELIHAGAAALSVGSLMRGVLEIYGTTNPLVAVYWIAGAVLTAAGWTAAILPARKEEKTL